MRPEVESQKSEAKERRVKGQGSRVKIRKLAPCYLPLVPVFLLLTVLSGCIALEPKEDPVKRDIDGLKRSMAVEQQKVVQLEDEIKKNSQLQTKRFDATDEARQKEKASANASIDKVREDMAFLNGKFAEIESAVKKAGDDAAALREKAADKKELDNRLISIQNQIAAMEKKLAVIDERLSNLEHPKPPAVSEDVNKEIGRHETRPQKPDELYNEAIKLTKDKDYSNALEKFSRFVSLFPAHDLASNAQYWIGEIYYAEKDYERAVLEFNEVVKKYPNSKKIPAALLKQGMAFNELGNKKEARLVLEKVVDKYAKTEEAARAKKLMKQIK